MLGHLLFQRHSKFTGRLLTSKRAAPRHVSAHSSFRVCFSVCALAFALGLSPLYGETTEGDVGELSSETLLYQKATDESEVLGKVPGGSVFTFLGEKENGFAKIRIELEDEEDIEGWIDSRLLKKPKTPKPVATETPRDKKGPPKNLRRGAVPKDEALLLRRDPSFKYGVYAGPIFSIMSHQYGDGTYSGMGFTGGGFLGLYLDKEILIRGEVGYAAPTGAGEDGTLSFGLLDIGVTAEITLDRLVLFGSLRYDMGIGIGDIPRTVALTAASDLNSVWADFGGGFKFPVNEVTALVIKGRYGFSFLRAPVAFQTFGAILYLEIIG